VTDPVSRPPYVGYCADSRESGRPARRDGGAVTRKLLLTVDETAEVVGLGKTKVYELIASGELEAVRIGRCRRVPVEAVKAYVIRLRDLEGEGL
jgi:excisionase family DNA binding protein